MWETRGGVGHEDRPEEALGRKVDIGRIVGVPWKKNRDDPEGDGEDMGIGVTIMDREYRERVEREEHLPVPRRVYIQKQDLDRLGYTVGCPGCVSVIRGVGRGSSTQKGVGGGWRVSLVERVGLLGLRRGGGSFWIGHRSGMKDAGSCVRRRRVEGWRGTLVGAAVLAMEAVAARSAEMVRCRRGGNDDTTTGTRWSSARTLAGRAGADWAELELIVKESELEDMLDVLEETGSEEVMGEVSSVRSSAA